MTHNERRKRRIMMLQLNTEERLLGIPETKRFRGDNRALRAKLDQTKRKCSVAYSTMRW